jgi:hypothetical protein
VRTESFGARTEQRPSVSHYKLSGLLSAEQNWTEANEKIDRTGSRTSDQDWLAGLVRELEIETDEGPKQGSAEKKFSARRSPTSNLRCFLRTEIHPTNWRPTDHETQAPMHQTETNSS